MNLHPNATTDSLEVNGVEAGSTSAPHRMVTNRLVLHRADPADIEFDRLHTLFADVIDSEKVFELCGWNMHENEADTRAYLDRQAALWEQEEKYEYVLEAVANNEYIGTTCLEVSKDDGSGEFGLWLRKPYWGRGFGGEQTDALIYTAFECLDAPYIVAGCLPANNRSRRAIEKFVRRYNGAYYGSPPTVPNRSQDPEEVVPHHEWVITHDQYASGRKGLSSFVPGVEYDELNFGSEVE
jgi:RimJ/RimL family protein N-acetyltransferase